MVEVLNEALGTEIVCVLRYKRHYYMASGIDSGVAAAEFLQHASEEQLHADQLAARITQLQGEPNFSPEGLASRSHSEYVEGDSLTDMLREDLVAERVAIASYQEIIRWLGDSDPTTRPALEHPRHRGRARRRPAELAAAFLTAAARSAVMPGLPRARARTNTGASLPAR